VPIDTFENSSVRAYLNKDLKCVVIDSKSAGQQREAVRAGLDGALELMRRHGVTKVMADHRLLQALADERASARHSDGFVTTQRIERGAGEMADYLHACGR
jgi:hypothetical protein